MSLLPWEQRGTFAPTHDVPVRHRGNTAAIFAAHSDNGWLQGGPLGTQHVLLATTGIITVTGSPVAVPVPRRSLRDVVSEYWPHVVRVGRKVIAVAKQLKSTYDWIAWAVMVITAIVQFLKKN
jgi:hypothetical protein